MTKRELSPVENERIRLRLLQEADLPVTLGWRNQESIRKWFFYSEPLTAEQHQSWYDRYLPKDNDYVFIIEDKQSENRMVGQVAIYNIDWDKKNGEFGRLMIGDPESAGKGLAKAATELILLVASGALGLEEVYLEVFSNNERAIAVYQKCGFQVDGEKEGITHMVYRSKEKAV